MANIKKNMPAGENEYSAIRAFVRENTDTQILPTEMECALRHSSPFSNL